MHRCAGFYWLAALFALFVLFLYGPMITIFVPVVPGPGGRPDVPDARRLAALVRQAVGGARRGRHLGGVPPLARLGARRDGC